jgi:CHAT domain-containing protein/Tfp pilus assembly protein PilF
MVVFLTGDFNELESRRRRARRALRLSVVGRCLAILLTPLILESISAAQSAPWPAQPRLIPSHTSPQDRDLRVLLFRQPIERELTGSERHSYQLNLKADEFIHIVAQQRGIDLVAALFDANGQQITEIDTTRETEKPENVLFVTAAPGHYRIDVFPAQQQAPAGRYEVNLEKQRPATLQDRNHVAAYQKFAFGQRLLSQGTASSMTEAIGKFKEAVPLWRVVEDRRAEAVTLSLIGKSYDLLGEKVKALDFYNKTLPLLRAVNDRASEATTLNNIGLIFDSLGEKQKALSYYSSALPILQLIGDQRIEAYTLNNIGLAHDSLGEKQKALDNYKRALRMLQANGDRRAEAATLNNIGFVFNSLGQKETALDYFGQALPILRAVGDHRVEAITLNNIGYVYESLGKQTEALKVFNETLPILRLVGDRRVEAVTLNNIGLVYNSLGEKQKALEYFNQSLPIRRAVGDRQGEAITLSDIGYSYASSNEYLKAMDYYNQALSLSRAVGDRAVEASTLQRISLVERDRGNLVEALKTIEAALHIVESLRTKVASQELRTSYFASAQLYFETYVDVLMKLHMRQPGEGHDGKAFQASERGRARSLLEMLTEAGANIRQGVDPELLQKERSLRQMLNAKAAEQNRLTQSNANAEQIAALTEEIKVILAQHRELEAQIRTSSPRYAALTQPIPLTLKEIQERVLDADTLLLAYSLGTDRSYLWMVTSTSLNSAELPPREEIEASTRRVYELLTARQRQVKFETAAERRQRTFAADAEYLRSATALSQTLLGPAAALRGGKKRLLIVSDGALNYVPFAALPIPRENAESWSEEGRTSDLSPAFVPLVVEHEIVGLPSASVLGMLRLETAGRKPAPKTLAVLADPVFERNDLRLKKGGTVTGRPTRGGETDDFHERLRSVGLQVPGEAAGPIFQRLMFTRQEANGILSLVLPSERLKVLDFEANLAAATNPELGRYRFVHFATHGLVDSARPELSGIVLSLFNREGSEQDGFLRVHEIFNLKLPVDLVVLSGCRTGLGKEIKGEGLIGLTRGFMYAGASRVMVSLWDVSDEASARLMVQFYKGMLGKQPLSPSAALRAAQIGLWKQDRWRAPYYWAAFVLQGEPR